MNSTQFVITTNNKGKMMSENENTHYVVETKKKRRAFNAIASGEITYDVCIPHKINNAVQIKEMYRSSTWDIGKRIWQLLINPNFENSRLKSFDVLLNGNVINEFSDSLCCCKIAISLLPWKETRVPLTAKFNAVCNEKSTTFVIPGFINWTKGLMSPKTGFWQNDSIVLQVKMQVREKTLEETSTFVRDYQKMYKDEVFSDFTIKTLDSEYKVHKLVLAARSTVLANRIKESQFNFIEIMDFSPRVIEELLRYMYTDKFTDDKNVYLDLYAAAVEYDLECLKKIVEREIIRRISPEEAIDVLLQANLYNSEGMREAALKCIARDLKQICMHKDFEKLCEQPQAVRWIMLKSCDKNQVEITNHQRKFKGGGVLPNYDIEEKSTFYLVSPLPMKIFMKTLAGRTYTFEVNASDTIESLKYKMQEKEGNPIDEQRLFLVAENLEDARTLSSCNIQHKAILHYVLYQTRKPECFLEVEDFCLKEYNNESRKC